MPMGALASGASGGWEVSQPQADGRLGLAGPAPDPRLPVLLERQQVSGRAEAAGGADQRVRMSGGLRRLLASLHLGVQRR